MGFDKAEAAVEGRLSYDPRSLMNQYMDECLRQFADMDEANEEVQPGEITREERERNLK